MMATESHEPTIGEISPGSRVTTTDAVNSTDSDMLDYLIRIVTTCTQQLATVNDGLERYKHIVYSGGGELHSLQPGSPTLHAKFSCSSLCTEGESLFGGYQVHSLKSGSQSPLHEKVFVFDFVGGGGEPRLRLP